MTPTSGGTQREHVHTRHVICTGYHRADGLWDIEGRIVDTKTYPVNIHGQKLIQPGDAIHGMHVRITLDDSYTIVAAEAQTDASPFASCGDITPAYAKLVGLKVTRGFLAALRERFGGPAGCTHITELLGPMATTAIQTIDRTRRDKDKPRPSRPEDVSRFWDRCYALRKDGEVARASREEQPAGVRTIAGNTARREPTSGEEG